MTTLEPLPPSDLLPMELPLMQSAGASRARTLALRDVALVSQTEPAAGYGAKSLDLLASYDPASSSWKTSQHSLDGGLTAFSETWPRSGMMRNGIAYQLAPLVEARNEIGSGLLPTLPKTESHDCSQASILARLDKGGRVARRICSTSPVLRLSQEIVTLNPYFADWLAGLPIGWTELKPVETL